MRSVQELLGRRGIGIDLDNTIVDYTDAFARGAERLGLADLAAGAGKTALRDALRAREGGELRWQELQAYAYGRGIGDARPFTGVEQFFEAARAAGVPLSIVSHKTRFAAADPSVDLRACAQRWLAARPFAAGVPVQFTATRGEKLGAIEAGGFALFIDDLAEIFADPDFPAGIERWLFAPDGESTPHADRSFTAWDAMREAAFGR